MHGEGTGWEGKVDLALGFSLVWSGPGIKTFTATTNRPVVEGEPTLFEIWVCADGYWCDHTKNLVVGELTPRYDELEGRLRTVYDDAIDFARPGASLAELDRRVREGIAAMGFPGQPSHPICHGVGARAHEPPYAHQAGGGEILAGMVLAIEPGCYIEGGGGLRLEDNFLSRGRAPRSSRRSPTGSCRPSAGRGRAGSRAPSRATSARSRSSWSAWLLTGRHSKAGSKITEAVSAARMR